MSVTGKLRTPSVRTSSASLVPGNPWVGVRLADEPPARAGDHGVVQRPDVTGVAVVGGFAWVLVAPEGYEGDVGPRARATCDAVQLLVRDCGGGNSGGELGIWIA